jgi:hypothetical protein
MFMSLPGLGTKNDCAGEEGQQQFTRPTKHEWWKGGLSGDWFLA